jgi:hypothetical protein
VQSRGLPLGGLAQSRAPRRIECPGPCAGLEHHFIFSRHHAPAARLWPVAIASVWFVCDAAECIVPRRSQVLGGSSIAWMTFIKRARGFALFALGTRDAFLRPENPACSPVFPFLCPVAAVIDLRGQQVGASTKSTSSKIQCCQNTIVLSNTIAHPLDLATSHCRFQPPTRPLTYLDPHARVSRWSKHIFTRMDPQQPHQDYKYNINKRTRLCPKSTE